MLIPLAVFLGPLVPVTINSVGNCHDLIAMAVFVTFSKVFDYIRQFSIHIFDMVIIEDTLSSAIRISLC